MQDKNKNLSRRDFINQMTAGTAITLTLPTFLSASNNEIKTLSAIDTVALGESGISVSRLGMGTGTHGGKVQREMGQEKFTRMIRYGLDQGITFIDTADNYDGMHEMLHKALVGVDRTKIQIQCKISPTKYDAPLNEIDRFRREVGTDYFDSLLIHCVRTGDWTEQFKRLQELLLTAKERGIVRACGVSMHGLAPLRATVKTSWGDIRQVRINHNGRHIDGLKGKWKEPGQVQPVIEAMKKMHNDGKGIIGMKLIGNGDFTDARVREKSIRFVMGLDCVDAVVIGFKSPAEIDEAIDNMNNALKSREI